MLRDGRVVATDPDRDRVYFVDVKGARVVADVPLRAGDEPGRVVQDGAGHLHVVLRGGGAIVDLDANGRVLGRREVCGVPRGIDWQAAGDLLWVACAGGELLTLPSEGGAARRTYHFDRDLRDVVVQGEVVYVSRFRAAEVLVIDAATGNERAPRLRPASVDAASGLPGTMEPAVAWRMIAAPGGGVLLSHQRSFFGLVAPLPGGYGGDPHSQDGCREGVVHAAVSRLSPGMLAAPSPLLMDTVLPVDVVADERSVYVAVAGNAYNPGTTRVFAGDRLTLTSTAGCLLDRGGLGPISGEVTALGLLPSGDLVVQTREPASLLVPARGVTIPLSAAHRAHTGHALFHANSGANLACASCHPEGGEDGRVWNFAQVGPRRTQSLRGGILPTAPFHWDGDQPDLGHLMHDVFEGRMGGPMLQADQLTALAHFLDTVPAVPAPAADPMAVARGRRIFEDAGVACDPPAELRCDLRERERPAHVIWQTVLLRPAP